MGHISAMDEELVDAEEDAIPEEVSLKQGKEIAAEQTKVERSEKKRVTDAVKEKREKRVRARQDERRARLEELAAAENSEMKAEKQKQQKKKKAKKSKTRSENESLPNKSAPGEKAVARSSRQGDESDGKSADDTDEWDEGAFDGDDTEEEEEEMMQGKLLPDSIVRALTEREQKKEGGSVSRDAEGALAQSEHWGDLPDGGGKEKKNKRKKEKKVNKSTEKLIIDDGLEVAVLPDPGNVGVGFKPSPSATSFHREQLYGNRLRRSLGMVAPKGLPGGGEGGAALFLGAATR